MRRKSHVRFGGGQMEKEPQGHLASLPTLRAFRGRHSRERAFTKEGIPAVEQLPNRKGPAALDHHRGRP